MVFNNKGASVLLETCKMLVLRLQDVCLVEQSLRGSYISPLVKPSSCHVR